LRILKTILYLDDTVIFLCTILVIFINRYNNRFLPLLWQFFLIPNRINKFVNLIMLTLLELILLECDLQLYTLSIEISTSKEL